MDHHFRAGAEGFLVDEALNGQYYFGNRPTGFYIPRFRNLLGEKREYLRGFGYQGSASRQGWQRAVREAGIGGDFKDRAAEPGAWQIGGMAFGEILPRHENQVTLDRDEADKWGLPVLAIDCETGENERLMREDMMNDMAEMLEAAGVRSVTTLRSRLLDGHGHPRDGHGAHGQRPADVGAEPLEPGLGRAERVRDRRLVHGVVVMRESVADVHGADGARRRSCRRRAVAAQSVILGSLR